MRLIVIIIWLYGEVFYSNSLENFMINRNICMYDDKEKNGSYRELLFDERWLKNVRILFSEIILDVLFVDQLQS